METIYLSHPLQLHDEQIKENVMALGYFDGVHIGHQQVIKTAMDIAKGKNILCSVMTFSPHPREVLVRDCPKPMNYITPISEKKNVIEELGVDKLYIVQFDLPFSKLTPQQFIDDYIIKLHVKHVVAGFDYTYGSLGKGTMETISFHSRGEFEHTTVDKIQYAQEKISSTLIRELLLEGKVEEIEQYLGREYRIEGIVVDGEKRGRTIGFPTANIQLQERYIVPKAGVYAVQMYIDNVAYDAVCNIGFKPTFHNQLLEPTIEVHIINFNDDIYGKKITVVWNKFIRSEQKFSSVDQLIEQIEKDKQEAIDFFQMPLEKD
ncbi:bifunctional riboflavin kinase/FAD synthetase [Bacillus sp. FJAT-45350]|uniref:bifunctional riboflavin kinase/FAD synthetase n=1 Tax=Bacillus sp. FJAT-45350 TaxID=2011014 RepID=UPI000BB6F20B|nr:bifunctional riboflavin kinase/FAD synthetase [Bacillus sp. FJAT-45350]